MTNPDGIVLTKTEMLRERIAEQFYGGYCDPLNREGYEWQCALENANQTLQACKEAGLKFVPDTAFSLPPTAQGTVTIMPIESPIKEIEL